mgnify:FL=1
MKRIEKLDKVLSVLYYQCKDNAGVSTVDISFSCGIEIDEVEECLQKLSKLGFSVSGSGNNFITFDGRVFFEKSKKKKPFLDIEKKDKLNELWKILKIVGVVINSIALILIGVWSINESKESKVLKKEIESMKIEFKKELIKKDSLINALRKEIPSKE